MFTFGREHEKSCALRYLRGKQEVACIHRLIDVVHDFLEGKVSESDVRRELFETFAEGGRGVWGQTDYWIRKLSRHDRSFATVLVELAGHPLAKVRLRTAYCTGGMPSEVARWVTERLRRDPSKQVRDAVGGEADG